MEIDLDGRVGFLVAHHVGQLNIELRPVEGGFAGSFGVRKPERIHRFAEHVFGEVPHFVVIDVFFIVDLVAQREPVTVLRDAEIAIALPRQAHARRQILP